CNFMNEENPNQPPLETSQPASATPTGPTLLGRRGRLGSFQRRLVRVFFVHKIAGADCPPRRTHCQVSAKGNYFFKLATWPAFRPEYLDLSRRSARRRRPRGHHTNAAPAGPRPHWQPEPCYQG